jgi:heparan-alpha-glucosaminide N-acetyltransferase
MAQLIAEPAVAIARRDESAPPTAQRLVSLDAYRGAIMLLLASGGLGLYGVSRHFPDSRAWQWIAYEFEHTRWQGCSLWDLIQPSFMFMAGVALPFSIASRRRKGQSTGAMWLHTLWRSLVLILLGIFLRSIGRAQTNFTFEDVVTQIGLGYPFLFLLAFARPRTQLIAAILILIGYWAAFALYPLPPAGFDYSSVGVPESWHHLTGFAAHWDKNTNFAAAFDRWFLNLFPRASRFEFNAGGYQTLSFIPSLVTMAFGMLSGELLRTRQLASRKFLVLIGAGVIGLALGTILDYTGICPSVKRIWTPSWTLFCGGWTCLLLAGFYAIFDWLAWRRLAFPLIVVGMNSIAMYCMTEISPFQQFVHGALRTHLSAGAFNFAGQVYAPIVEALAVTAIQWLICLWMYRRKIFLRV